jgi:hypothetical protein
VVCVYEAPGREQWAADEPSWGTRLATCSASTASSSKLLHCNAEEVPREHLVRPVSVDPRGTAPAARRSARVPRQRAAAHALLEDAVDVPVGDRLVRPYFGMHRFDWSDDDSVEFHLPHGELVALLRASGFEIEELVEVRPPEGSTTRYTYASLEWARSWPTEEVWKVRRQ